VILPNSVVREYEKPVPKGGWPTAVALPVLAALLLTCYFPMLRMTGQVLLFSDDMAQGLFSVVVAAYLAWLNRDALLRPAASPSFWALPVLAFAACLGVFAVLANSSTFSRFAFLLSLAGCLLIIGGWGTLRKLSFALALLLFTFPIPQVLYGEITQPLQLTATRLSELTFETLGYSVIREGNILQLTYMTLSVAEACSGLRSLITLFFFCLVYGYFFEDRLWLRIVIVFLACPAAILVNVLRITLTGILGHYNQAWTHGTYHEFLGWSGFFVGFFLVFLAHRCIGWLVRRERSIQ
jgi:exosortase